MAEILSIKNVSEYLGIHEITVYKLVNEGKLLGFKVGGQWRFRKDALDKWMADETHRRMLAQGREMRDEGRRTRDERQKIVYRPSKRSERSSIVRRNTSSWRSVRLSSIVKEREGANG